VKNNETFLWDVVSQSKSDERLDGVMTADLSAR